MNRAYTPPAPLYVSMIEFIRILESSPFNLLTSYKKITEAQVNRIFGWA